MIIIVRRVDQEDLYLMRPVDRREYYIKRGNCKETKLELKLMKADLQKLLDKPLLGAVFSYSHPLSKASVAATLCTEEDDIPDELVGLNPTRQVAGVKGTLNQDGNVCTLLKRQRKDMAKLTKKLLKPQETERETSKRLKEKKIELQQKRAAKKREKRRKKRTGGK